MKITYPQIAWDDVQAGDTVLAQMAIGGKAKSYVEFTLDGELADSQMIAGATYYLIDRPKPVFPEEYGSIIIAKKVRGFEFPEGVVLVRQRGTQYHSSYRQVMWKSVGTRISGADNHGERQIEDWVLAKVVPA